MRKRGNIKRNYLKRGEKRRLKKKLDYFNYLRLILEIKK